MFKRYKKKSGAELSDQQEFSQTPEFYLPPEEANGPKGQNEGCWKFDKKDVLFNSGVGGFSVAIGTAYSASEDARGEMIAMRWNGVEENQLDTGFPKTGKSAEWFPIPREFACQILIKTKELADGNAALAALSID